MINNVSFIKKFIIICLIFAGFGLYADDLNPDKERVIRGANVAFQISAPKRWVFDNKPGSKLLIYPSEYSNDNTPIVIYAMAGPPQCTKTDDLIKVVADNYKRTDPEATFTILYKGRTKEGFAYEVYQYLKNPNPRPERVAYIQLPEAVACIIFTSKNLISYNNYIEKLDEVIGSVKYRPDLIGKWMEYTSSDASFSVFMPATPVETVKQVNTPAGAIDVHIFSFEYKDLVYIVSYSDYPEEVVKSRSIADMLDNGRNGVVSNVQGKLLSELIVSLNEFPGRELRIETPDGKGTIVSRIFLVRNRFYQVAAATYKENSFSPAILKYLDSFRLLEKRAER